MWKLESVFDHFVNIDMALRNLSHTVSKRIYVHVRTNLHTYTKLCLIFQCVGVLIYAFDFWHGTLTLIVDHVTLTLLIMSR